MKTKTRIASLLLAGLIAGAPITNAQEDSGIELSGDLRLRQEFIDKDDGSSNRQRQRLRARLNANADVNENVKAGIRLASGSAEPTSTNQSFDDAFSSKPLQLDKAYLSWQLTEALELIGGKMGKPWINVSELVWDGDVNPEGFAAKAKTEAETISLEANAGYFWLDEISSTEKDRMLYTGQIALGVALNDSTRLLLGGSAYIYDHMKGLPLLVDTEDGFGNESVDVTSGTGVDAVTRKAYAEDFEIFELFGKISSTVGDVPVSLLGQLVSNDAASRDDSGFLIGAKLGKAKEPGSFEIEYNYRDLEENAVLGAFSDSDFAGGGTDAEGHVIKAKLALAKAWTAGGALYLNRIDPNGKDIDYSRVQIDLIAKF